MKSSIRNVRTAEDFRDLLELSHERPVLLFKHSTRCPTSAFAHHEFQSYASEAAARGVECAQVLVVESRAVSTEIASALGVRHESPQAILIRNGEAIWHDSHGALTEDAMKRAESDVAATRG